MEDVVRMFIPIMALSIPLVIVTSVFLVQPVVRVLGRLADAQNERQGISADSRVAALEQRLTRVENALERVLEEQEFHRQLRSTPPPAVQALTEKEAPSVSTD